MKKGLHETLLILTATAGVSLFTGCIASGSPGDESAAAARASAAAADSSGEGAGTTKVTVCHIPPGNPANMHTIVVGEPAVRAHLAHGDKLGACSCTCGGGTDSTGGGGDDSHTGGGTHTPPGGGSVTPPDTSSGGNN